jgi:hypothetical protein
MADRLGIHVGLKDPLGKRIRGHPDVATAETHAAGVFRFGLHRFQELAIPVDQMGAV